MRISVNRLICGTLLIGSLLCSTGVFAKVLHVSSDGDGSDGLSWETAFISISDAMVQAASGDSIWVREGTYSEQVVFNEGVSLFGGFSGTETLAEFVRRDPQNRPTVIDGEFLQPSDQKGRNIFDFTHTTVIGNRDTRIDGFTILGGFGGCFSASGLGFDTYEVQFAQCDVIFEGSQTQGPAIFFFRLNGFIDRCFFSRITDEPSGAIACDGITLIMSNSVVVYKIDHKEPIFSGSSAIGGRFIRGTINNCVIYEKSGSGDGVIAISMSGPTILLVANSIITGERPRASDTWLRISYSDVIGGHEGPGNIDADPLFVDPENNDFRLMPGSPCIDAGTTMAFFPDRRGNIHTIDIPMVDFDGNPRPLDVPGVGRDGEGAFDMGAYEFPGPFRNSRTDINEDGRVDALDLTILLGDWKKVSGP